MACSVYGEFSKELLKALLVKIIALAVTKAISWCQNIVARAKRDFEAGNYSQEEILRIVSLIYVGTIFLCLFSAWIVVGIYRLRMKLLMLLPFVERFIVLYCVQNVAIDFADNVISGFCKGVFTFALPITSSYSGSKVKGVWISGVYVVTEVVCFLWGPGVVAWLFCTLDIFESMDDIAVIIMLRTIKFLCSVSWTWMIDQCSEQILQFGSNLLATLGLGDVESYLKTKQRNVIFMFI